jgi:hypothetical protein
MNGIEISYICGGLIVLAILVIAFVLYAVLSADKRRRELHDEINDPIVLSELRAYGKLSDDVRDTVREMRKKGYPDDAIARTVNRQVEKHFRSRGGE